MKRWSPVCGGKGDSTLSEVTARHEAGKLRAGIDGLEPELQQAPGA